MNEPFKYRVQKRSKTTQTSYELPHRLHTTKTYPCRASNGSTITIYGHESGLKVLWRGGRPLKRAVHVWRKSQQVQKSNPENDAIMIIDSDEDEEPANAMSAGASVQPRAEFEDEDGPSTRIVQHVDIPVQAAVVKLSFPNLPRSHNEYSNAPPVLLGNIIIAAGCEDGSVHLITVPITPPSNAEKEQLVRSSFKGYLQEARLDNGPAGHKSTIGNLSVTWTARDLITDGLDVELDDEASARALRQPVKEWNFVIASSSADVSGLLVISRVPIDSTHGKIAGPDFEVLQRIYLSSPATSVAFSSAVYPVKRATQLLVAEREGIIRVYGTFVRQYRPRRRRGSDISTTSSLAPASLGSWLATFTVPYETSLGSRSGSTLLASRKSILSAAWICQGRGVIILFSDGEHGVWDYDSASPDQTTQVPQGQLELRGSLGLGLSSMSSENTTASRNKGLDLAPMTPKTRKVKEQRLFSALPTSSVNAANAPTGGIAVIATHQKDNFSADEDVVLWFAGQIHTVTGVHDQWKSALQSPDKQRLLTRMEELDNFGEIVTSVDWLPASSTSRSGLVLSTEHRLLFLTNNVSDTVATNGHDEKTTKQLISLNDDSDEEMDDIMTGRTDQYLLADNDLGLDGVNRMLDGMDNNKFGASARRVGFVTT